MSEQKPSVGRIVHFHHPGSGTSPKSQPYPAIITHVWGDTCVNLSVIDDGSFPMKEGLSPTSVMLAADATGLMNVWTWPPRV